MNMLEKANEQYDDLVKKKEIVENDKVSGIGADPCFMGWIWFRCVGIESAFFSVGKVVSLVFSLGSGFFELLKKTFSLERFESGLSEESY